MFFFVGHNSSVHLHGESCCFLDDTLLLKYQVFDQLNTTNVAHDKVSSIVEVSLLRAAYFDIPKFFGARQNFLGYRILAATAIAETLSYLESCLPFL